MRTDEQLVRSFLTRITSSALDTAANATEATERLAPTLPAPPHLQAATQRALEKVATGQPLQADEQFAVEAIIIPDKRPAVRIIDGTFSIAHSLWTHFQDDPIRSRITAAIPSVGRLDLPNHPSLPYGGTAFVVGEGLLMTNRHVAELFTSGLGTKHLVYRSNWQPGIDFKREDPEASASLLSIRNVVMIHPYWDMALLRVDGLSTAHPPIKLSLLDPEQLRDREVAVIGYPAFDPRNDPTVQREVFGSVFNVKRLQPGIAGTRQSIESFGKSVLALTHDSSTLGGNSGSIVLDVETGSAIALHFGGIYLKSNYGVPAAELGRDARVIDAGVLFDTTPRPKTTGWEDWWRRADEEESAVVSQPPLKPAPALPASDAMTWTIPIEITVRVGAMAGTQVGASVHAGTSEIIEKMVEPFHDDDLSNRRGYDRNFLGVSVALPKLKHPGLAAPVTGGGNILNYHHFSLVMHKTRRIAMYTASNIDTDDAVRRPESGKDYTRKGLTGLADNDREKWFPDPRVARTHQLPDRFFTNDKQAFDKGHIVRREDVAWGNTYREVRVANGDTYHTTNCSPQVKSFNQSGSGDENWGDLENYVLKQAKTERLSLFAGPMLDDDDQTFVGVDDAGSVRIQIPSRYWKVVLAVSDGTLQSYGFILEQDLSDTPLEFAVDAVWRRHMIAIADLEAMLPITFPKVVRDADQASTLIGESAREAIGIALHAERSMPPPRVGADRSTSSATVAPVSPTPAQAVQQASRAALPPVGHARLEELRQRNLVVSPEMDPRLQVAAARQKMGLPSRALASATADEVPVIARVTNVAAWEALSEVRVGSVLGPAREGTLVTARIPVSRVEAVRAEPCVLSLKASQPLRRNLAATTQEMGTRAASYPVGTAPDGGAGVLVGIVDFGCDFAHENFRNADGTTRLLGIWHQSGGATPDSPNGYGRLYSADDINAALEKAGDPYGNLGYGPQRELPGEGAHGTHVMDIAAGNGRGTNVLGNAPKADLLFVEAAASDIAWGGPEAIGKSFGDSVQMLEAVKFIFDQAGDRPCVVNLSLGTNGGPHDGTTLVEQGLDSLVLGKPNRAIVISASNSHDDGIHAAGTVPANGTYDLVWQTVANHLERELEIWLPGDARAAVEILAPQGSLGIAEPGSNLSLVNGNNELVIFASNRLGEPNNGDNMIGIYVAGGAPGGDWVVRLHSRNGTPAPFHAWVERQDGGQSHFNGTLDNSHTIGSISCGRETIAVGSFDAHKPGRPISYFSSEGPTRDGRQKPEISAPGHAVVAARSRSGNGTTTMSGTSMAAPAVTGLVALILAEARRRDLQLSSSDLRAALFRTAYLNPPEQSAGDWHPRFGHGRAHARALNAIGGSVRPNAAAPAAAAYKAAAKGPRSAKRSAEKSATMRTRKR